MKIVAIANQKGGVGKTTTTISLAGLVADRGERALVVDLDPHGSLTAYLGFDPESNDPSVYELFTGSVAVETLVRQTPVEGLSLLPASTALATLDRQLGSRSGMGLVLRRAIQRLEGQFDYVFVDCPPVLGVLMVNALAACQRLLVPVQTEFLALKGLERMVNTLRMIQRSRSSELPYTIVPTLFDRRTRASADALEELRAHYPDQIWKDAVPIDTQFREASRAGLPLTVMQPWARGSQAYRRLLQALERDLVEEDAVHG